MNPLIQLKQIRILPRLIVPVLVAVATLAPVLARATPSCGFTSTNLLAPVPAGPLPVWLAQLGVRE